MNPHIKFLHRLAKNGAMKYYAKEILDAAAEMERLTVEIAHLKVTTRPRIRGVDFECEQCGHLDGSTRDDRGFMRCNKCGYPSP